VRTATGTPRALFPALNRAGLADGDLRPAAGLYAVPEAGAGLRPMFADAAHHVTCPGWGPALNRRADGTVTPRSPQASALPVACARPLRA